MPSTSGGVMLCCHEVGAGIGAEELVSVKVVR